MDDSLLGGDDLIPAMMFGLLDDNCDDPAVHLCARCDTPIEDGLEECPVCAAEFGDDDA